MLYQLLDVSTSGLQVLTRIEVRRILIEVLTDGTGHSQTQIGVDVDLAYSMSGSLTQLLLRDTNSIGHLAAVLVDHLYILLRNGRRTMEYDREAGQSLLNLFQNIETQRRRNQLTLLIASALCSGELVCTVGGTDSDSQGIAACTGNELLYLLRTGVMGILSGYIYLILNTSQSTQLSFYYYAMGVSILYYLLGDSDVLLKRLGGSIDHNGGKSVIDTGLAGLKAVAMIQMQNDRDIRILDNSSLNHLYQIGSVGISTSSFGYLQDNGGLALIGSLSDSLNDLHVVNVESADSITAIICLLKHFSRSN
jgi:hypothetical protein